MNSYTLKLLPFLALVVLAGCTKPDPSVTYGPLLQAYVQVWNTGNFDQFARICDPDFTIYMTPDYEPVAGLEAVKKNAADTRTTFPDFRVTVEEVIYGPTGAAARWTMDGTNTGPGPYPATGKKIHAQGLSLIHYTNGKLSDEWIAANNLKCMEQLGFTLTFQPDDTEK